MNTISIRVAVVAAAAMLLVPGLAAQNATSQDGTATQDNPLNPGYPQPPQQNPYPQSPQQPMNSVNPSTGTETSPPNSMRDSLGAPGETGQQMLDKQFLRKAVEEGIGDVKMATLAIQKGGPSVKELAQKLVDDHTTFNKDMASVADSLGIMVPKKMTKDQQEEYDKLNGLSGKDFDTEYLTYIVKARWQNLHAFYMEASVAADPTLQTEVVKAMFMMHQHLGLITKAAADEGIALPARPPRPSQTTAKK